MQPGIWECDNHHIHVIYNGVEMEFETIYDFLDALGTWQEYVIFHMMKFDFMPEEAWEAFAEANKN